jgi:hypothetical protein
MRRSPGQGELGLAPFGHLEAFLDETEALGPLEEGEAPFGELAATALPQPVTARPLAGPRRRGGGETPGAARAVPRVGPHAASLDDQA